MNKKLIEKIMLSFRQDSAYGKLAIYQIIVNKVLKLMKNICNIRIWKPYHYWWKTCIQIRWPHTNIAYNEYGISIKILWIVFIFKYKLNK